MNRKEIIDGLKMTMGLILFDPSTGEDIDPDNLNDLNRTTYDACKGAVELLESQKTQLFKEDATFDCISRQNVNDALEKVASFFPYRIPGKGETYDKYNEAWNDAIGRAEIEIKQLPSAQPERKRGKWIRITQGAMPEQYICPFCHRTVEAYGVEELLSIRYPYCHCGADMRGEQT